MNANNITASEKYVLEYDFWYEDSQLKKPNIFLFVTTWTVESISHHQYAYRETEN